MSEQFCDVGRGITLCYETFGDPADPPVLLIMGLSVQMLAWHEDFCEALADRGLYVVRFDNRDIGRSTHVRARPPTTGQLALRMLLRPQDRAAYTLSDMAQDTANLLERLELAPAHVIGASMGGMIAQMLAAQRPDVVRSLVSIMSNTGSRWSGQPRPQIYPLVLQRPPSGREGYIEAAQEVFGAIGSSGLPQDTDDLRELAASMYDRDHDPAGPPRQLAAIIASGNRTALLRQISAPTLVIHGSADPLIAPSGGRATASAIPGARLLMIEGMGHDLPRAAWPIIVEAIGEHIEAAEHQSEPLPHRRTRAASRSGPLV